MDEKTVPVDLTLEEIKYIRFLVASRDLKGLNHLREFGDTHVGIKMLLAEEAMEVYNDLKSFWRSTNRRKDRGKSKSPADGVPRAIYEKSWLL